MFMRYFSGGVGHIHQSQTQKTCCDSNSDGMDIETPNEEGLGDDHLPVNHLPVNHLEQLAQEDTIIDDGCSSSDESDSDSDLDSMDDASEDNPTSDSNSDSDMGPEDGEDGDGDGDWGGYGSP
jgi:hypothetical protein